MDEYDILEDLLKDFEKAVANRDREIERYNDAVDSFCEVCKNESSRVDSQYNTIISQSEHNFLAAKKRFLELLNETDKSNREVLSALNTFIEQGKERVAEMRKL